MSWDPLYANLEAYSKVFDYDLAGRKVRRTARFFEDPQSHIELWVRQQQMEIISIGASVILICITLFLCNAFIIGSVSSCCRTLRYLLTVRSVNRKYKKVLHKSDSGSVDADAFAADVYRKVVSARKLYKYCGKTDMSEYESGRFSWESISKTGLAHVELLKRTNLEKADSYKQRQRR